MPDREKVIKALEICEMKDCAICPYTDWCGEYEDSCYDCTKLLAKDALDLLNKQQQQIWEFQDQVEYLTDKLKEQKTVEPKQVDLYGKDDWWGLVCICPDCKAEWMSDKADTHFCPKCGQAVKWE